MVKNETEEKIKKRKTSRKERAPRERRIRAKKGTSKEVVVEEEKKNNSFSNIEVYIIMIICLVLGLVIGILITGYNSNKTKISDKEVSNVYNFIKENHYEDLGDSFEEKQIEAMVNGLNDPFGVYYDKQNADCYRENLENEFIGIGTEVYWDEQADTITTVSVFKDRPAEKAGIKVGDILVKVGDKSVTGMNAQEASSLIKGGKPGDKVDITVLRGDEEKTFTIEKDAIHQETVYVEYFEEEKIAKVAIDYFSMTTYDEFKELMDEIEKKGYKKLALDLRFNNFGYVPIASQIAGLFLDEGTTIYKEIDRKGTTDNKAGKKEYDFDIVLIVNEYTAKGAEVLASALIENLDVKVMGKQTAGDNTLQKTWSLNNGGMIQFTAGKWTTSKGHDVKETPITPEFVLENEEQDYRTRIVEVFNSNSL